MLKTCSIILKCTFWWVKINFFPLNSGQLYPKIICLKLTWIHWEVSFFFGMLSRWWFLSAFTISYRFYCGMDVTTNSITLDKKTRVHSTQFIYTAKEASFTMIMEIISETAHRQDSCWHKCVYDCSRFFLFESSSHLFFELDMVH